MLALAAGAATGGSMSPFPMAYPLPSLILTGASGIVGRSFLASARGRFRIYASARRPQHRMGVDEHPDIRWIQVHIENAVALARVMAGLGQQVRGAIELSIAPPIDGVQDACQELGLAAPAAAGGRRDLERIVERLHACHRAPLPAAAAAAGERQRSPR